MRASSSAEQPAMPVMGYLNSARNGAPLSVWQSVQLQMVVVSESASASNVT
jgi:hypothetical protein